MNKFPPAQGYLDSKGKKYYEQICKHLDSADYLMDVDSFGLSMMAQCLRDFYEAAEEVNKGKPFQVTKTGYQQKSGAFTVMTDCYNIFHKLGTQFGLSPGSRESLMRFKGVKKNEDEFDKI